MKTKLVLIAILILLIAQAITIPTIVITGWFETETVSPPALTPTTTPLSCVLTIQSYQMTTDRGLPSCQGLARNDGSEFINQASVRIRLYDSNGYLITTIYDHLSSLDVGQTWAFGVTYPYHPDVASCDVEVGSCNCS
jgi:hypothetical protein